MLCTLWALYVNRKSADQGRRALDKQERQSRKAWRLGWQAATRRENSLPEESCWEAGLGAEGRLGGGLEGGGSPRGPLQGALGRLGLSLCI